MNADIARSWILANAIALAVATATALIGVAIRRILGIGGEDVPFALQVFYVGAEAAMSMFCFAMFARLSGAVLDAILPGFPHLTWKSLHMVLGVAAGIGVGLSWLPADDQPLDWDDEAELIFVTVVFVVGGGLLGAAFGGLQAYVMRPVAYGLRLWVMCSAAGLAVLSASLLAVSLLLPSQQGLVSELVFAATAFGGGLAAAIVMLPALQRLRPRFR